jgi:hypothetical protein
MSIVDREHRELYRVYDEAEFLTADGRAPAPGGEPAADPLEQPVPYRNHLQDAEPWRPPLTRRGRRVRPVAMLLGAGLGVLVIVAVHLHATVARPARPPQQLPPVPPAVKSRRPAHRARRAQAMAPRVAPARRGAGARRGNAAPPRAIAPAAAVLAAPAASHRSSREFGFER